MPLGGICDRACVDFFGGIGGGLTKRTFVGFENVLEGNGGAFTNLVFADPENFLEGSAGGFAKLAFMGCCRRAPGRGIV